MLDDLGGHVLELIGIVPELVEQGEVCGRHGSLVISGDEVGDGVAPLIAQIDSREATQWRVDGVCSGGWGDGPCCARGLDPHELLHGGACVVAAKLDLAANPVGAFTRHGALGQLVAQLDLELTAGQTALAVAGWDVELAPFLADPVRDLTGYEGRGGEDELERLDMLQLGLQGLVGIHREAGGRYLEACARLDGLFEVLSQQTADVVDQLHPSFTPGSLLIRCLVAACGCGRTHQGRSIFP